MHSFDPFELARAQIAADQERTAHMPSLFDHKVGRMSLSAVGCLRGAAPLYYQVLRTHPELADGPPGEGWIAGDLHVENFGVYRPEPAENAKEKDKHADVVFDLNDFDDAVIGPWRFDVMRLATSLVLAVRGRAANGHSAAQLAQALIDTYVESAFGERSPGAPPKPVAALLQRAADRTRTALLDGRTKKGKAGRRFIRDGARYVDLSPEIDAAARKAFAEYAQRIAKAHGIEKDHFEVLDTAFRIAGTGSVGTLRVAVLARGKGGDDGAWIFDMKAEGEPSAAGLVKLPKNQAPAERVLTAIEASLARRPHLAGTVVMEGQSMLVRRLAPQEDKLDIATVADADLDPIARYLGALTGAAHRRAATQKPGHAWSKADRAALLNRTLTLVGMHEAIYIAYTWLVHDTK